MKNINLTAQEIKALKIAIRSQLTFYDHSLAFRKSLNEEKTKEFQTNQAALKNVQKTLYPTG